MASEGSRHIYLHPETNLNIDVFSDELFFCHRIPFLGRLTLDSPTICTTDLLLEKMQIVEINLKDFKDTIAEYRVYKGIGNPTIFGNTESSYPCVKYKLPSDPRLDGTATIYVAD